MGAGVTARAAGGVADNILSFARTLRAAGLPVGPGAVLDALQAVQTVGLSRRDDFYWTLNAVFVKRQEQQEIFDQAFHVFWRNPQFIDRMRALLIPTVTPDMAAANDEGRELSRRLTEALAGERRGMAEDAEDREQIEIRATLTWSDKEVLARRDFESLSTAELEEAKAAMARLTLPLRRVKTRRWQVDRGGPGIDARRSLRAALRQGGDALPLVRRKRRERPPPLVVLTDISGSMGRYARMLLHFLHALTNDRDRVQVFLFGTRLTAVTRQLRHRDPDEALAKVAEAAPDWDGGTRIGACLAVFNRDWARRVLAQGAVVLLITDGLDRAGADGLTEEMERLHKSCRRLIWLNPLLRYAGYAPKSLGARAMLPQVDEFRSVHNLASLADLAEALSQAPPPQRRSAQFDWSDEGRKPQGGKA
ncbi:MAG: VWA domain-containing protein [Rhodospirillales bacterium]|nr:VWA domain-containing protein [Rhodospirillales bacterium]